jgi:transposase-like protein
MEEKMSTQRNHRSAEFKAQVALEAIEGRETINEIAKRHGVHPNMVSNWKKEAIEYMEEIFKNKRDKKDKEDEATKDELYKQIGQLKVEVDWLKKKSAELRR